MNQTIKDIISGFISGWTQVIIMQPLKQSKFDCKRSIVDCFKKIAKEEGMSAFYKGTVTPLIGIGFYASAMFFTYEYSKRFFGRFKQNPNDRLPLKYVAISGFFSSFPAAFVAAPVEHARIRIQIQKQGSLEYAGSVDAAKKITHRHGLRGLFRGFSATFGRQSIGLSCYFTLYEIVVRSMIRKDQKSSEAPLAASLLGGAFAGIAFFLSAYPMDYIKTMMQTDNLDNLNYKNFRDALSKRIQQVGIRGLYAGLTVAVIRAIFVNAGGFFAFQTSMRTLGRSQDSQ